jgi:hypothetical protein
VPKSAKRYDVAQTPYRRLSSAGVLDSEHETARYRRLNPAQLKRDIDSALDLLWTLAEPPPGSPSAARTAAS